MLEELHINHPGIQKMKLLAQSHVWWPHIDQDIQEMVKVCCVCQEVKQTPPVAHLHPCIWPSQPWKRIHVDFAGPFMGGSYLIVVDAHSKWPKVQHMSTATTTKTQVLRSLFARYGIPERLVSDNGPQFVSEEFETFMKQNGVKHIKCSPYHPSSNGQAERFVRTFKLALQTGERVRKPLDQSLENFLIMYRVTTRATTGETPCKLFLGRDLRTRLHLRRPQLSTIVRNKLAIQKIPHDNRAKHSEFVIGQHVMARNFRPGRKYLPGVVVRRLGPLTFLVEVKDGLMCRRHVDHLKPLQESPSTESTSFSNDTEPNEAVDDDTHFPFADNAIPLNPDQSTQQPQSPIHQRNIYPE